MLGREAFYTLAKLRTLQTFPLSIFLSPSLGRRVSSLQVERGPLMMSEGVNTWRSHVLRVIEKLELPLYLRDSKAGWRHGRFGTQPMSLG